MVFAQYYHGKYTEITLFQITYRDSSICESIVTAYNSVVFLPDSGGIISYFLFYFGSTSCPDSGAALTAEPEVFPQRKSHETFAEPED